MTEMASAADAQAVYRCFSGDGQLLYIGTTGNLGRRLAEHAQKIWFLEACGITLEWYPDEASAQMAERRYIQIEHPKYNVVYRDAGPDLMPRRPSRVVTVITNPVMLSPARRPVTEGRKALRTCLVNAPEAGISPKELMAASGFGNSTVHQWLSKLLESGEIMQVRRGRYRLNIEGTPDGPLVRTGG